MLPSVWWTSPRPPENPPNIQYDSWKKHLLFKRASFSCHAECVESCWIRPSKNVLFSAVMLNMLNMLNVFGHYGLGILFIVSENIQQIQQIQHESWKGHIFRMPDSTWFNIFNMTAERSTFLSKCRFFFSGEEFNVAQKWFFQQTINMCYNYVLFQQKDYSMPPKVVPSAETINNMRKRHLLSRNN